jgi:hypothetical protein
MPGMVNVGDKAVGATQRIALQRNNALIVFASANGFCQFVVVGDEVAQSGDNQRVKFARFGVAAQCLLGKHQFAIDHQIKNAAFAGEQAEAADKRFDGFVFQQFVRQTDGTGGVVSGCAVFERDVERGLQHRWCLLTKCLINQSQPYPISLELKTTTREIVVA